MSASSLRLSKLHGAGNDFLVTVAPDGRAPDAALVMRLCDRHRGIGADGLITLLPGRDGADGTMELRNADGSRAEMSGNGIGCLSWVAVREGLGDGKRLVVDTGGGRREVELDVNRATGELVGATVDMGPVTFDPAEIPVDAPSAYDLEVTFHGVTYHGDAAGMGNPHLVLLVDDPETTRVTQHGPHLETDDRFPHRTNVEFVAVAGEDQLTLRVWERGVGETLSSGTSSIAAAAAAIANGWCEGPVTVHLRGGDLRVALDERGDARLAGPVVELA
jgi:diaminopimelate epimerase